MNQWQLDIANQDKDGYGRAVKS